MSGGCDPTRYPIATLRSRYTVCCSRRRAMRWKRILAAGGLAVLCANTAASCVVFSSPDRSGFSLDSCDQSADRCPRGKVCSCFIFCSCVDGCKNNDECPAQSFCNSEGFFEDPKCEPGWHDDSECSTAELCSNGSCIPTCTDDSGCAAGNFCGLATFIPTGLFAGAVLLSICTSDSGMTDAGISPPCQPGDRCICLPTCATIREMLDGGAQGG